jgi:hypothetical protein
VLSVYDLCRDRFDLCSRPVSMIAKMNHYNRNVPTAEQSSGHIIYNYRLRPLTFCRYHAGTRLSILAREKSHSSDLGNS